MKKIINGKKYDTETATKIGFACGGGLSFRDFEYWEETLYKKKTGEYFLFGEGGPASKYSVSIGSNSWSGGERFIPMTREEAAKWAEEALDVDAYEEEFGEVPE